MILAAAMVCGMMAANVSCVSAKGSDEGKCDQYLFLE